MVFTNAFAYDQADVPEGVELREWRRRQHAPARRGLLRRYLDRVQSEPERTTEDPGALLAGQPDVPAEANDDR